ncbi:broad-specificity phosphatase YOR283W [[Candida] anglica]|uniref:Broad-specificity phosphatase YOR283W n=1 Tax=[Candida] anglica TaxID=148631 RepID=A0ABP0EMM9_9ASCO
MTIANQLTNSNPKTVRIFVIRHGQTDHNVKKILQGHRDIDINENGEQQAKKVGERFKTVPLDGFITSDLIRCRKTADEILVYQPELNPKVKVTEDLRERNMGPVEGMYIQDAIAKYSENFRNLGEKEEQLVERVGRQWDDIIDESIEKGYQNYGFCTHGGVITTFTNYLHRSGYTLSTNLTADKLKVPFNTSVTVIDIDKESRAGHIQLFGDTAHLGAQLEVKDQNVR